MRQTSVEAFHKIKNSGVLSKRRWQAYECLFHNGPLTGQELSALLRIPGMWKRCSELKRLGLASDGYTKICKITGQNSMAWDVTDRLPPETPPRTPRKLFVLWSDQSGKAGYAFDDEETAEEWCEKKRKEFSDFEVIPVREIL